ncbi:MAG: CDP-glycerol glycerophosphotransferase family protein [Ignavibacteria bacterium]|nr:CDP-glycerol glycerophosphotransferase family protein [Ignavibacteria bacterium]
MLSKHKGKILFAFSDPGGAKPILALIEESEIENYLVVANRSYPFYKDFKSEVKVISNKPEDIIKSFKPDLIFTGTSYPSDFDKQFIKLALENGIECYSFVDHWTNMNLRFRLDKETQLQPDQIWMIDERAKKIAIENNFDESKIFISGNPYHRWLKKWKPVVSKNDFLKSINLENSGSKLILFAPDPLTNINGKEKYGFDELTALADFINIFASNKQNLSEYKILIKAHPNQKKEEIEKIIINKENFILLNDNIDTNTSIYYSDLVVGFFSSLLLEAEILNKKVLRYIPVPMNVDPIGELNVGKIVNKDSILENLLAIKNWN